MCVSLPSSKAPEHFEEKLERSATLLDLDDELRDNFLPIITRFGEGSKMVVTGDLGQTDLPKNKPSGLKDLVESLRTVGAPSKR